MNNLRYNKEYLDNYFMSLAEEESKYSSCRRKVGAIIASGDILLARGHNSQPIGLHSCEELGGCMRQLHAISSGTRQEFCRAVHAEQNAIINAFESGISIAGGTLYVTTYPCSICTRMLINCKLNRIVYKGDYQDQLSHEMLDDAEIEVEKFEPVQKKIVF